VLSEESHLSDQELLLAVDGELSARDAGRAQSHLAACWTCRVRKQEIEATIGEFIHLHRRNLDVHILSPDGRRASLKMQLAQLAEAQRTSCRSSRIRWPTASCTALFFPFGFSGRSHTSFTNFGRALLEIPRQFVRHPVPTVRTGRTDTRHRINSV